MGDGNANILSEGTGSKDFIVVVNRTEIGRDEECNVEHKGRFRVAAILRATTPRTTNFCRCSLCEACGALKYKDFEESVPFAGTLSYYYLE